MERRKKRELSVEKEKQNIKMKATETPKTEFHLEMAII